MANQVTLTFAGEEKPLQKSFSNVGDSAEKMGEKVGRSGDGFDRAGEAADAVDTKAMGFRDTMTGVQDSAKGTALIMKGDLFNGFLTLGMGVGDLASGFFNFLIPALKASKLGTIAQAAASKIAAGASKVWAGAQWLMNTALLASPVTWIVLGIIALIAVIVLIATKTTWFQTIWRNVWKGVTAAASASWNFIKKIPGWIGTAFSKVAGFIMAPYRAAFNGIARAWNNTVGRLSWSVPGWVPFIGGNSVSVPHLPTFHSGTGVVPGVAGTPTMALLQAGERVDSIASDRGAGNVIPIGSDGSSLGDALIDIIYRAVDRRGGSPGVLGIRIPRAA